MDDNSSNKVTRRDFLKFLGFGALTFAVGSTVFKFAGTDRSSNSSLFQNVSGASPTGSWAMGPSLLSCAIQAALLPNGKILYLTGSDFAPTQQGGPYLGGIFDPVTNAQTTFTFATDVFCSGNCVLQSGNVLLTGGTIMYPQNSPNQNWWGSNAAYEYNFVSNSFTKLNSMAHGRWYPTQIVLSDGTAAIVSGLDEFGCQNGLLEVYDPNSQSFSIKFDPGSNRIYCVGFCTNLPGAGSPCYGGKKKGAVPSMSYFPRMHLMPNGLVASVGMNQPLKTYNPSTGQWVIGGNFAINQNRAYGSSVLLPLQNTTTETGKILSIGGAQNLGAAATNQCEIVTPNGNSLQTVLTASMQFARFYIDSTILPTGQIFVNGGTSIGDTVSKSVYAAEMFDPISQTWTTMPSAKVSRRYHQVALLLPDGTVWTAGTTNANTPPGELRTEIFSPAYVFATRPTISGNPSITGGYGGSITIPTPDAANITSVSLVRVSSVTHHYSSDQRLIWLQIQNNTSNTLTVAAPINSNIAPPGYYMVFILNQNSIPSIAKIIRIPSQQTSTTVSESLQINDGTLSTNATKSSSVSESLLMDDGATS